MKRIVERIDDHRPSEVHSAFLKKFFQSLTSALLEPLERYMISLIPSASVTALKPLPSITPFNQDDFFRSLSEASGSKSAVSNSAVPNSAVPKSAVSNSAVSKSAVSNSAVPNSAVPKSAVSNSAVSKSAVSNLSAGINQSAGKSAESERPTSLSGFKSPSSKGRLNNCQNSSEFHPAILSGIKGDWTGLYKKFFRSPNFSTWFNAKFSDLETSLKQLHIKAIFEADLIDWIKGRSEVEVIDLVLTLKQKIRDMENENGGKYHNNQKSDSKIKDSDVRDSSIRDSSIRDSSVRDSSVRDSDVRDSSVRSSGFRSSEPVEERELLESEAVIKANHEHIVKLKKLLNEIIRELPEDLHPILNKSIN